MRSARGLLVAVLAALALPGAAAAGTGTVPAPSADTAPTRSEPLPQPGLPGAAAAKGPRLTEEQAVFIFRRDAKVRDWLERYPRNPVTDGTFDERFRQWKVGIWSGEAGQIAVGKVDDGVGSVTEAWTGPQVAWKMARGYDGAFGGKEINSLPVWLAFCAVFLLGLADLRRPFSIRNLDLLALLSFSVSLWFFNRGDVFWSVPLVYPPLLYLLGRMIWRGWRGRGSTSRAVWPVWVLAAATVFLMGFRIGLNVQDSNVIDVGYASVIGGSRILDGEAPYGNMPVQGKLKACGPADDDGEIRERIQTNGRCESSNDRGDTYGPLAYSTYIPGVLVYGWSGKWDELPAAHLTSILFDVLCVLGLALVGRRFGGWRLAATLAFAWAAWPFTQYVSSSNTNDAILPAFLIWGFWLVTSPWARGISVALAGWTKFAALIVAPLWASYPDGFRRPRAKVAFTAAFLVGSALAFWVLLLEPSPLHAARVFAERTVGWQIGRESPFSLWDWRQYHADGLPDLHLVQRALQVLLVLGAIAVYFVPRRKTPLQLAALTAALLIGFELVLTHWFYLYLPWFFPFVAYAVLAPAAAKPPPEPQPVVDRQTRALVATG